MSVWFSTSREENEFPCLMYVWLWLWMIFLNIWYVCDCEWIFFFYLFYACRVVVIRKIQCCRDMSVVINIQHCAIIKLYQNHLKGNEWDHHWLRHFEKFDIWVQGEWEVLFAPFLSLWFRYTISLSRRTPEREKKRRLYVYDLKF